MKNESGFGLILLLLTIAVFFGIVVYGYSLITGSTTEESATEVIDGARDAVDAANDARDATNNIIDRTNQAVGN